MKTIYTLLLLLFMPLNSYSTSLCNESNWPVTHKTTKKGTEVFIHELADNQQLTPSGLACVVGLVFFDLVDKLPNKAVIVVVNKEHSSGYIIKWDLVDKFFLLIDIQTSESTGIGKGSYTKYPDPLNRIKEILINKPFPNVEDLSLLHRRKVETNYFFTNVLRLNMLLEIDNVRVK